MNGTEFPDSEVVSSEVMWSTPTTQTRPRPATIHAGFTFITNEEYSAVPSWDTSSISFQQTPSETMSRPMSMHQDFCPPTSIENASWIEKPCEDHFDFNSFDQEMSMGIGQAFTTDEAIPVLDLRYGEQVPDEELMAIDGSMKPRRMSGSSFSMSTSGALSDMPSYEDFSTALSEAQSFSSDYPPTSNRNSLMSSTQLSPVASPRIAAQQTQTRTELVRTQSRGRGGASPSPRPGVRSAPYSVEGPRLKRWSTGTYGTMSRKPAPFVYHTNPEIFNAHQQLCSANSSPAACANPLPLNYGNLQAVQAVQQAPFMVTSTPVFQRSSMLLPSQLPSQVPSQTWHPEANQFEAPPPLLSHGLFRMLQSNGDPHSFHGHYTDLSDPPDLYAALQEEQIPPPPEDMNPEDPDLIPREQELRFEGDLYTPRWVRGHGNKREGWCGICKPGRWLVLKNSAFWYDKSFSHGVSAATGSSFQEPQQKRRMDGNPDVWEGLCGSCNEWVALVSSKKKGTTWFRHAYKCHTHLKIKDTPKRRRESSNARAMAAASMAMPKLKNECQPSTPQMASTSLAEAVTPTPVSMAQIVSNQQPQQMMTAVPPSQMCALGSTPETFMTPTEPFPNMI
ncbi:hypothetical protein B0T10DRAFT_396601 [Thelonectria olida]|uniref:Transcription regulator Rua1 C-terminal domain-containing protein n=1 Tax=Thelonectria olida TaxID=1576542 RepID=A0A9P8WHZ0_9HYPO|nr:hypothetical protein B0T10DRAFT_396601 [Thelonectria olida]